MGDAAPVVKAFCVGQAKAGTTSLAGLLGKHYRAAHEPERAETLEMILRESRGEIEESTLGALLLERDKRLNLEYDIAWANQFLMRHLVAAFPNAKFVVLLRDPYTWLESVAGHMVDREIPPDVRAFLDWWFRPDLYPHTRHSEPLGQRGLYSLEAFLRAWSWHVAACLRWLPPDRRLILRTHELDASHGRLAEFLGVPVDRLDSQQGRLNRSTASVPIASLLERGYLDAMVESICGEHMARHFLE